MSGSDDAFSQNPGSKHGAGLSFEQWRSDFFTDAEAHGLLHNTKMIGDFALRLFWEQGIPPTVQAVQTDGNPSAKEQPPKSTT